jgi:hypothetical protein
MKYGATTFSIATTNMGRNKSCLKFSPFCMAWTKVGKMNQLFNKIFNQVWPKLAKIFCSFKELNKKLHYYMKIYKIE